jgi:hypothetical protein
MNEEMNEAGYQLKENFEFLPEQSFTILFIYKQESVIVRRSE